MSDKLKLKSGKEIYCNCGIIGLAPKSDDMDVYGWHPSYGYDGKQIKTFDANTKFGIRAIDLGPAVAFECARQGYGEVLWMK